MKKTALFSALFLILLLGGGVVYFMTNINAIIKSAIEDYGSKVAQAEVSVRDVDLSFRTGEGSLSGFRVGSPESFVAARSLDVGKVTMKVDTGTLRGTQPIIIEEIVVNAPHITYEVNAKGQDNLRTLQKNISAASARGDQETDTPRRNVIIRNLYIRNGTVSVTHSLLQGQEISTPLPLIHLTDIGQEGRAATPEQVAKQVLGAITQKAAAVGASAASKELRDKAVGETENVIKDTVGKLFSR